MLNPKELLEVCLKNGAHKVKLIDTSDIQFDDSLRNYCIANQCQQYGTNYGCPPFVGETEEVIAEAKSYKKALVFQSVWKLTDSYDIDGMKEAMRNHTNIANNISDEIAAELEKHLDLRAGPCVACEECSAINNDPCRYPEKRRISLEAYCINVTELAKVCDMNYINGTNTVTYFGAFLFDCK